jgi:hypothetical protein
MLGRVDAALGALLLLASACTGGAFDSSTEATEGGAGVGAGGALDAATIDTSAGGSAQEPDDAADATVLPNPESDALAPGDGAKEAALHDAAPSSWCAGRQVAFCADFDRVNAPTEGWTTANVSAGAALDFDLVAFTSATRSLHSRVPAGTSVSTAANLHKAVSTTLTHSVLEFDCDVKSIGTAPGDWLLQVGWLARNGPDEALGLYAAQGKWSVLIGAGQIVLAADLPAPPQYGRFVRVTMDVVWSQTAGTARVAFDGVTVFTKGGLMTSLGGPTKAIEIAVGFANVAGGTPAGEMSIDNVTLQLQ